LRNDFFIIPKKDGLAVICITEEFVESDKYDFIVCYTCDYDDILHEETPSVPGQFTQ